jgi:hypothetical protein
VPGEVTCHLTGWRRPGWGDGAGCGALSSPTAMASRPRDGLAFERRCIPFRCVARRLRTAVGTPRSSLLADRAPHRSRCSPHPGDGTPGSRSAGDVPGRSALKKEARRAPLHSAPRRRPASQFALRRPRYERDLSGPPGRRQRTAPVVAEEGPRKGGKEEELKSQPMRRPEPPDGHESAIPAGRPGPEGAPPPIRA